ncbi:MAG: Dihydrolipoamide acetyltransferase component of pyruvate dehydrogenase complex [Solirubrobacterales bacterium]|nr:Dihydrolipoamide acetyltransferase component of pyruvate dehydrogenase complex [Solirubrobacterales bacterium]
MPSTAVQDVAMPRLSDSMEEGTVLNWLKQVGDEVALGEELVEIETDKANMGYEADVAGTLLEILVQENETAPVGAVIARIGDKDAVLLSAEAAGPVAAGDPPPPPLAKASSGAVPPTAPPAAPAASGNGNASGRVKASPLARRIASELGVDIASLGGTGPGGRIVKKDVERASSAGGASAGVPHRAQAEPSTMGEAGATGPAAATAGPSPETAKGSVEVIELTKLQQVVSRRMSESKATAPHFYLTTEVDMGAAVAARTRIKEISAEGEVVPSFNDMVVKACAIALRKFPRANGAYKDGRFELYSRINVGIAVAANDALVVPTIFDADKKGLREIAADARSLAGKVRDGSITPPELSGGTFSVSNLGMYGIKSFGAIVNSPQAGILAVGEIADRAVVEDGRVVPGKLMEMTLSCDHRILYGADGAGFLAEIKRILQEPLGLAL